MKKKFIKMQVGNSAKLQTLKKQIRNSFTEDGKAAADALEALIDELEVTEAEIDEDAFKSAVEEFIANYGEVPEAVAEAITKRVKALQNSLQRTDYVIPDNVRNEICKVILRSRGDREEITNAVNEVLKKNEITGFTFEKAIDYAVVTDWADLNPLFKQFYKTPFDVFHYSEDDIYSASMLAKQWDKTSTADKVIQQISVQGKTISTKYIYKRQRMALEDLDNIEAAGQMTVLMRWLNEELDRQIVNTIVMAVLIGDNVNTAANKITTFESIGTKTESDVFTTVLNPATAKTVTIADVRTLCDSVKNPYGKNKVLVISQTMLTQLSKFLYATGGTETYKTIDEMKGVFGVSEIFINDILTKSTGVHAICMIPSGYWYKEKNALSVTYPQYEKNVLNYQKERNIGGGIHDFYSTAVLKEKPASESK